ncbi:response regulator transcription factor [Paenactinomyces guangxiensis]|uniref:Response regulator transcription factor n=1 Tax=Paenactinomyces guangxiensis TaxID=1490290 RepID=A0A7W2A8I0_9BACL|nr:response regulator transcription factor [Paenactinomyces guangxiensis]MBA4494660.1 response regulator transcription factor [Paenactinomyces guangxiensis]MBH8591744.1 response regulator transcription factor [Paenactinomyces guangxiensis]
MKQATVLIVDDEIEIVELIRDFLEAEEFQVITAHDGKEAVKMLQELQIDCLLLDVMMPKQSGFDTCREIRQNSDVPILFLSARQEDTDKIRGLSLGGDDYIVKSATPGEIVARIKAVLRRTRKETRLRKPAPLRFGDLLVDLSSHEVSVRQQQIPLTAKEFELLRFLVENPRQVFTLQQLYDQVWREEYGDLHTVRVHIARIREKIEENPAKPRWIQTVWGIGYKFAGGHT